MTQPQQEEWEKEFEELWKKPSNTYQSFIDFIRSHKSLWQKEAYDKGQIDAFEGRIENMKILEIKEKIQIPDVLLEEIRQEARIEAREEIIPDFLNLLEELKKQFPLSGDKLDKIINSLK